MFPSNASYIVKWKTPLWFIMSTHGKLWTVMYNCKSSRNLAFNQDKIFILMLLRKDNTQEPKHVLTYDIASIVSLLPSVI